MQDNNINNVINNNNITSVKKHLIYISNQTIDEIEQIVNENSKTISIVERFRGNWNLSNLLRQDLKSLNNVDYFVLDLSAILNSTDNNEIVSCLDKLHQLNDFRIIIIARGFKRGNVLLAQILASNITNIVTATTDSQLYDQLKICLSEKGMTYQQASQFKLDNAEQVIRSSNIIEVHHEKVRQDVTIGVVGASRGIGTTTFAINLLHFLSDISNLKPCLIEVNNHNDLQELSNQETINGMGVINQPSISEISIGGMDIYTDLSKIGEIKTQNYEQYIYDFGSIDELDGTSVASFLNKDIKFVICGSKPWEYKHLVKAFSKFKITGQNDSTMWFIFNFVKDIEQQTVKEGMEDINIYFAEYQPDPFEKRNTLFLEEKFRSYLSVASFEEKTKNDKKSILNKFFKK